MVESLLIPSWNTYRVISQAAGMSRVISVGAMRPGRGDWCPDAGRERVYVMMIEGRSRASCWRMGCVICWFVLLLLLLLLLLGALLSLLVLRCGRVQVVATNRI